MHDEPKLISGWEIFTSLVIIFLSMALIWLLWITWESDAIREYVFDDVCSPGEVPISTPDHTVACIPGRMP